MIDKKKLILPIAICVGFIVIIITISIILMTAFPKNDRSDADVMNPKYIAVYENNYQLEYSVGKDTAKKILDDISSIITNEDELSSATNPITPTNDSNAYLTSVIKETSFKKIPNIGDNHAYSFTINVSDGRSYHVVVRTDSTFGHEYIATFIKNLSTNKSYFLSNGNIQDTKNILDWGKSLDFTNPTIVDQSPSK
ncbi:hypothetical protein IKG54_00340 [Candidatus Saccharibacteria bacterium]|nr:hypothetical protein [Candidatus Saccharibacteria bacterium]